MEVGRREIVVAYLEGNDGVVGTVRGVEVIGKVYEKEGRRKERGWSSVP